MRQIGLEELEELEPELNTEKITSALFSRDEYIVDSWLLSKENKNGNNRNKCSDRCVEV